MCDEMIDLKVRCSEHNLSQYGGPEENIKTLRK